MSDQIINHFLILQEFIEKISKKSKINSTKLNAISDHIISNIDNNIESINNDLNEKIKLEKINNLDDKYQLIIN